MNILIAAITVTLGALVFLGLWSSKKHKHLPLLSMVPIIGLLGFYFDIDWLYYPFCIVTVVALVAFLLAGIYKSVQLFIKVLLIVGVLLGIIYCCLWSLPLTDMLLVGTTIAAIIVFVCFYVILKKLLFGGWH